MRDSSSNARFGLVVVLLLGTVLLLHARRQAENIPHSEGLASFPMRIGPWEGKDVPIDADTLQVLGPGHFLSRIYTQAGEAAYVDFFIAYFPSQKTGDTIHSPKNCLPGAGWSFTDARRVGLSIAGRAPLTVNEYTIAKGTERQLVLYWYQAHGRVTPSEYWAKFHLVVDAIRLNRTDGALVRIVVPIVGGEGEAAARAQVTQFAHQIVPLLSRYIPN